MTQDPPVIILGAGAVGRAAARYAARRFAGRTLVADCDMDAARSALRDAGAPEGQAVSLDVTDTSRLVELLRRGSGVLNCVGPFFRFGPPILDAAIAAGRPYLDVCDDWEPTIEMLTSAARARRAGVVAVIGQGASPGTANLLALAAAQAVAPCVELLTGWSLDDDPGEAMGAASEHWLHQSTGRIRVWRDGYVDEAPLAELEVNFPGLPPRPALTVGHPEAVTLPRSIPSLKLCLNVMTLPGGLTETLRQAAAAMEAEGLSAAEAARRVLTEHRPNGGPTLPEYPGVWAIATGDDGRRAGARLASYGDMTGMGPVTAAPLVAGMELILQGQGPGPGVWTPEAAFTPGAYFAKLAEVTGLEGSMVDIVTAENRR